MIKRITDLFLVLATAPLWIPLLLVIGFAVLMMGAQEMPSARYIGQASTWFLPTGWLNYVLLQAQGDKAVLALLLPIAGIVYLARFSWARLRGFYSLEGLEILPSQGRNAPDLDDEALTGASFGNRPGPTEIEDRIAARTKWKEWKEKQKK